MRSEERNSLPPWTVRRQLLVALISFAVGSSLFVIAVLGMLYQTGLGQFDEPILAWMVQHRTPIATDIMWTFTTIASPIPFTCILSVIAVLWVLRTKEVLRPLLLLFATGGAAVISVVLKNLFVHPRPPHAVMVQPFQLDYSFPSGHTIAITTFVLIIGYLICARHTSTKRISTWILISIVGIIGVGGSRLYFGYHWFTDVIASLGLGLVILAIVIVIDKLFVKQEQELQQGL